MTDEKQHGRGRFVVITGLSGSGKSSVLKAMEDLGYYAVDNLPPQLLPSFVNLPLKQLDDSFKVALGMDIRGHLFPEIFPGVFSELLQEGFPLEMLFLEASDDVLLRRFSETRRAHPVARANDGLAASIRRERALLEPIRAMANQVLDTSKFTIHQLRRAIAGLYSDSDAAAGMQVNIMSFGYKFGLPGEADLVMDVRFLPNPYFVDELRPLGGKDEPVAEFVLSQEATKAFLGRFLDLLKFLIPHYQNEGKSRLTVAIGCTGGRHRSVALAEWLARQLSSAETTVTVRHRDLDEGAKS
ncbi:conserved hypothetical protein [Desulfarculus baarsii DSM 2075]|uniref:Uncharacterized protein n=1 Tax=Desulfarculus baarsii (strain ATCC 33931 / DSM 2075 / LMG 7858 / VKM B-1802 / 2st14) TaxID=644282 RepID=E1QL64_DESB2|nr:RNase adapter RapZ [Desulfarculus baarsii]ADK85329.1 conserved hypothetical protein [Desulfarculus baarsii DSM 2075]